MELDILVSNTIRVINNRPITQVMPDSAQILRPVDFLIPQFFDKVQEEDEAHEYKRLKLFYDRLKGTLDRLWDVWQKDYIHQLLQRNQMIHKQTKYVNKNPPTKGEIVLMYDENTPRNQWRLAQIIENIVSKDGKIRVARILLGNGRIVNRPINHLYSLEIPITSQASSQEIIQHHPADSNLQAESSSDFP